MSDTPKPSADKLKAAIKAVEEELRRIPEAEYLKILQEREMTPFANALIDSGLVSAPKPSYSVKRWQAWVIADNVQRFAAQPELFVTDADHELIVADLERDNDALKIMLMDDAHTLKVLESKLVVATTALERVIKCTSYPGGDDPLDVAREALEKLK